MRKAVLSVLGLGFLLALEGCSGHHPHGGSGAMDSFFSSSSSWDDADAKARARREEREEAARRYERRGYNSDDAWSKAVRRVK